MALPSADKFTFKFPLAVANDGGIAVDTTVDSQVKVLFAVYPGQRLDDLNYGNPGKRFEQSTLNIDSQRMMILLSVQLAIVQYIPDIILRGLNLLRDKEARRLILEVLYADKKTFQRQQKQLLDLGLPHG